MTNPTDLKARRDELSREIEWLNNRREEGEAEKCRQVNLTKAKEEYTNITIEIRKLEGK